jgi:hypothetical protein
MINNQWLYYTIKRGAFNLHRSLAKAAVQP